MASEAFDAVLAEQPECCAWERIDQRTYENLRRWMDRLSAAHAAEVAELRKCIDFKNLFAEAVGNDLRAAGCSFDSSRTPIIQNDRAEAAERDARRWQAMREHMVAVDWKPEMGGGPVVMFECMAERVLAGPEGADAIADAAVEFAAIATAEGAP